MKQRIGPTIPGDAMRSGQSVNSLLSQAGKAAKSRDWATAIAGYTAVLDRFPANKKARLGLDALKKTALPDLLASAKHATATQSWPDVERCLTQALALGADQPDIRLALARAQSELSCPPQALDTLAPLLSTQPQDTQALTLQARALRDMGHTSQALEVLGAVLSQNGDDPQTLNSIGLAHRASGDFDAAHQAFTSALVLQPDNPTLHNNLSQVIDYRQSRAHLDQMQATLAKLGAQTAASVPLHFALFKALDDLQEYDAAFHHLKTGNTLAKQASGYTFQSDAIPYALSKALFDGSRDLTVDDDTGPLQPIFVTGLPRSGTTLVERILSQSPDVQPCGELTIVPRAVSPLLRSITNRSDKQLTPDDIASLRDTILNGFAPYSDGRPRPVDKMPMNFRWIGYICPALPRAHIVHMNRDPMAVAWSLYRHAFTGQGIGYSNEFRDIAQFMALHKDLMAHWRSHFPDRVIDIDYDALVTDPESTTQSLAQATELNWTPDWVTPETATSAIQTASAQQARKSIYKNSDDQWRRYERHLSPLGGMLKQAKLI